MVVCFAPSARIDQTEFEPQMELQEDGLNRMSPSAMIQNRPAFDADGHGSMVDPLGAQARNEFANAPNVQALYAMQYGDPFTGLQMLQADVTGNASRLVAPHNPDMAAGGVYNSVADSSLPIMDRIGTRSADLSMGQQWTSRAERLGDHARKQQGNGCPTVQVDLRMCRSRRGWPGEPLNPGAGPPDGPPPESDAVVPRSRA